MNSGRGLKVILLYICRKRYSKCPQPMKWASRGGE